MLAQEDSSFHVRIYVSDRLAYIDSVKYYEHSLQLEDMKENIIYNHGVTVRVGGVHAKADLRF